MLKFYNWFTNWWNETKENVYQSGEDNFPSKLESKEKITILSPESDLQFSKTQEQSEPSDFEKLDFVNVPFPETNLEFDETLVQNVLLEFEKLDFKNNNCFDEIADSFEKKGKSSLFNYVILKKWKDIIDALDRNLPFPEKQEEFRKSYGYYILQVDKGNSFGKELQDRLQFFEEASEQVLSDFKKLNFNLEDNKCEDPSDSVNYNKGRSANPLDKIANYYRWKNSIFLFNYVVLRKQIEIMGIIDKMLISQNQEQLKSNFKKRFGRFLLRISEGMNDAKELINEDEVIGFFDGRYVEDKIEGCFVNHYDNLNIMITKPEHCLETSRLFSEKIKRMEITQHEIQRVKIYSKDRRILTIEKNDKQQRNYTFNKAAKCNIEICCTAKDESAKDVKYSVVLNIDSHKIGIGKTTINGKDVESKEILELAKQNDVVLIRDKTLHQILVA